MVLVNNKKFKIYDLDTIETFKARLAASNDTLEKYLYFPNGITYDDIIDPNNNIVYENLLKTIKNSAEKNLSIISLVKDLENHFNSKNSIKTDVVYIWMAYNKKLNEAFKNEGDCILDKSANELVGHKIYISNTPFIREWKNRKQYLIFLNKTISMRNEDVKKTTTILKKYNTIESDESGEYRFFTDFQVEKMDSIFTLDLIDISLLELFNSIVLTSLVPVVIINNFYKISKDFIPSDEDMWTQSDKDSLTLKVYNKKLVKDVSMVTNNTGCGNMCRLASDYKNTIIRVNPLSGRVTIKINVEVSKDNIDIKEIIKRSFNVFQDIDLTTQSSSEINVSGIFYFPMTGFNKKIFADLVMNNEIFSRLINIDDSTKATKNKRETYIHFDHPSTGYITATITEKIMTTIDQTMKNVDKDIFPVGSQYIRIYIKKANNLKSVKKFQDIFSRLYVLYDEEYNTISNYYRFYIKDFGKVEKEEEEEEEEEEKKITVRNKDIDPELFITNYSRNCKMPTIISETDAKKMETKGVEVMKFPRDSPAKDLDAIIFPRDGYNQHYYMCDKKPLIYPGLKKNKLENSDIYPYVPCCYMTSQKKKDSYIHYYEGKKSIDITDKQYGSIITTDKFLNNDQFGHLPLDIKNLFAFINKNETYIYVRKGVFRNENSFLDCVMVALNETETMKDDDERLSFLLDERMKLATKKIAPLARQELYDISVKKIISMLKDPNIYLDPKLFIHILEDYFKCNIYLFTNRTIDGSMELPRHTQAYYKNMNKNRCIYIYEHTGFSEYPQCELIVRYHRKTGNTEYSFSYDEASDIRKVYRRLRKSYALNNIIKEANFYIPEEIKIKSQWIDSYGKTRVLNILFNEEKISLILSPIQPVRAKEITKKQIYKTSTKIVLELTREINMQLKSQTVIDGKLQEINGVIGNVHVSIPVNGEILPEIDIKKHGVSFSENKNSDLFLYNKNKKLARYIVNYTLWIYSKYLKSNNIIKINNENLSVFSNNFFKVVMYHEYKQVPKTFSNNSSILDNGKIIVRNTETIKRLLYVIRLNAMNNHDNVIQYHSRKVIKDYYVDVTDFKYHENQIVLFGDQSIEKWKDANNINYFLHKEIYIGKNTPYFFKNKLINDVVYLAQNTTSIEKAKSIAVTWINDKYNSGIHLKELGQELGKVYGFTLYSYTSPNDIKKYNIKGTLSSQINIVGYKRNKQTFYTVLLSL
jgi:hypothetical protein